MRRLLLMVILTAVLATPVRAQFSVAAPDEQPAAFMREALAHPYGRALVAEFAKQVRQAVEPACLQSKKLDDAALGERGRDIFQRYGARIIEVYRDTIDPGLFDAALEDLAGRNTKAEIVKLREHPDIRQYLAIERSVRLARALDAAVENFDRYVLILRIPLKPISPFATGTGNEALAGADPTDQSEAELERFRRERNSRQVDRFHQLSRATYLAFGKALNTEKGRAWGPVALYKGIENELAELCIVRPGPPSR